MRTSTSSIFCRVNWRSPCRFCGKPDWRSYYVEIEVNRNKTGSTDTYVQNPEGHRNVVFAQRGVRTLPRVPRVDESAPGNAPDTQMLYRYLRHFNGIAASHTSGTNMGTDWRDNDPLTEPVVEIYQGDRQNYEAPDAPRSNNANDSIGGWRPKGFISLALEKGYKLAFEASSDHISTHMSYCNLLVTAPTREALVDHLSRFTIMMSGVATRPDRKMKERKIKPIFCALFSSPPFSCLVESVC